MESERVRETKKKIKNAFLDLYKKKRIEKITVKEVTEKAQINRGTFYVYYIDIYDLKEKIEDEVIRELKENALPMIRELIKNKRLSVGILPKEFFYTKKSELELFFGEGAEVKAIEKLKKIMQGVVIEMIGLEEDIAEEQSLKMKYALEYVSSAQIGLVSYWFRNDMKMPAEELGKIIEKINLTGAITYLANDIKKVDV